jgi:hypothetical protein
MHRDKVSVQLTPASQSLASDPIFKCGVTKKDLADRYIRDDPAQPKNVIAFPDFAHDKVGLEN